jgi:hypothetical protein
MELAFHVNFNVNSPTQETKVVKNRISTNKVTGKKIVACKLLQYIGIKKRYIKGKNPFVPNPYA